MKPMLAANATMSDIPNNAIVQPKIDGVRGLIIDGVVMSRTLKPIPNQYVQEVFGRSYYSGLDGEFVVGCGTEPDTYRKTTSAVMTRAGTPDITFCVFDDFSFPNQTYMGRRDRMIDKISKIEASRIVIVPQQDTVDRSIQEIENEYLALGYEGIIVRDPYKSYKYGRSTLKEKGLLKIKRFADSEAVIIRVCELVVNENDPTTNELGYQTRSSNQANMRPAGMLGAIEVKDLVTGVVFSIGSGFTEEQRIDWWHNQGNDIIGKTITYQHFPVGVKDKPRFPTFKGFRS